MLDWLIKNARIVDGTSTVWFRGNVGIQEGKIAFVGTSTPLARQTLDVQDKMLSPGFIDIHSHSDFAYFRDPANTPKLLQGVTTEVNGNCGLSMAPVSDEYSDELVKYTSFIQAGQTSEWNWRSFADFLREIECLPLSINAAFLVGQGTVRIAAMGFEGRTPTINELAKMKELVTESMEAGAFGISTGLIYPPGVYSTTEELIEVTKPVASYGGVYCTHIRNESNRQLQAINEALTIGQKTNVPVHISHHKVGGIANWGQSKDTLAAIDKARQMGQDVTIDQYPYLAGATTLSVFLPPWAQEGGINTMLQRLSDPVTREKIKDAIANDSTWENLLLFSGGWKAALITSAPKTPEREGKTLEELGQSMNRDPGDVLLDTIRENGGSASCCIFMMNEEDVQRIMKHPAVMIGSDGIAAPPGVKGHPRMAGTFVRILGHYTRDKKVLTIEQAVHKMTLLPARRLGLYGKGLVQVGCDADLVIFDPDTVAECATYKEPDLAPVGVDYVFVNGILAVDNGRSTGAQSGKVVRHRHR